MDLVVNRASNKNDPALSITVCCPGWVLFFRISTTLTAKVFMMLDVLACWRAIDTSAPRIRNLTCVPLFTVSVGTCMLYLPSLTSLRANFLS